MCEFTREGFQKGCQELGVESIDQLKAAIPRLRNDLEGTLYRQSINSYLCAYH